MFLERRTSDREAFDRIISVVDDDDSDHSDIGELNDSDNTTNDTSDPKDRARTPIKDRLQDEKADSDTDKPDNEEQRDVFMDISKIEKNKTKSKKLFFT